MPYKPGQGRTPLNISESEIRYAMSNAKTARGCARFLKVTYRTYEKYAKRYVDSGTGKTLYELSKNKGGKGTRRNVVYSEKRSTPLDAILRGEHPNYDLHKLKHRLLRSGEMAEQCDCCGFEERRITDYTVPLLLIHLNGDRTDHRRENLQLLCYNCTYLQSHNTFGGRPRTIIINP